MLPSTKRTKENEFHKTRHMFVIMDGRLYVAPKNISYSHDEWIKSKFLIEDTSLINKFVKGFADQDGVYFYKDNFSVDRMAEEIFFSKIRDIVKKLKIDTELHVYGGMIKQKEIKKWPPKKDYGLIIELLKINEK